jgi:tetratricopeptide (TPR) repeat protein
MNHHRITLVTLLLAAALLSLGGCHANQSSHKENVNAAESRWAKIRSDNKLTIARQQFETGDLDQAEKTLLEAIGADPVNARLWTLAGRIALERGQLEKSAQRLTKATELDPKSAEPHYYIGIVQQRWKQFDRAHEAYAKAYELQADNVNFLLAVSEMLAAMERTDEALALLESKATYFDQNSGIRVAAGQLYLVKGNFLKAAEYFRQASLLRPDDLQVLEDLASARIGAKQYKEAIGDLQRLVKECRNERRVDLLQTLASTYMSANLIDEARATYLEITRLDRNDIDAWIKLGEISLAREELGPALSAANRVISLASQQPEGYLLAGLVWQKRKEIDKALTHFDRAASLAPGEVDAVILRGITLEQAGRFDAARVAYKDAMKRKPEDGRAKRLLAQLNTQADAQR